ncbi:MAG: dienelactone hydrolase family protein [Solibacillus sp.]|uniref:dienelactone hydrolase family protein n=1 Tax=unclassified Solibacillus TaxID=2637870 RepID=UPI0030FBF231
MELKQDSNQCVILLHEIYGINEHILHYANVMYQKGFDVYVPDLLNRSTPFPYEAEERAYENFITNIGFISAQKHVIRLINRLSKMYVHIRIIGFSIGATVGWICSRHPSVHKIIGFYGSRIRQYAQVVPKAEITLFYGEQERSFCPTKLKVDLSIYPNVFVKIVEGEHGFADPYSTKYNEGITNSLLTYLVD